MKTRLYQRVRSLLLTALVACMPLQLGCAQHANPPQLPSDFVSLAEVDASIALDLRYAGTNNFVGARIEGCDAAKCLLTRTAAEALARVQQDLRAASLGLVVLDCYRPRRAVDHFERRSRAPDDAIAKARFYPRVAKSELFARGYIAERGGHSRGSALDLSLAGEDGRARARHPAAHFDAPIR